VLLIVVKRQLRNFSAIIWQEQVNFQWDGNDDEGHFVLDQHALWDSYSASSLSAGKDVAPLDTDTHCWDDMNVLMSYFNMV
jgi:hypothetical protein